MILHFTVLIPPFALLLVVIKFQSINLLGYKAVIKLPKNVL